MEKINKIGIMGKDLDTLFNAVNELINEVNAIKRAPAIESDIKDITGEEIEQTTAPKKRGRR